MYLFMFSIPCRACLRATPVHRRPSDLRHSSNRGRVLPVVISRVRTGTDVVNKNQGWFDREPPGFSTDGEFFRESLRNCAPWNLDRGTSMGEPRSGTI